MKSKANLFNLIVIALAPIVILILLYTTRQVRQLHIDYLIYTYYALPALRIIIGMVLAALAISIINTKQNFSIFCIFINLIIVIGYYYGMMIVRFSETSPFGGFFRSFSYFSMEEHAIIPLLAGFYLCMLTISIIYAKRRSNLK